MKIKQIALPIAGNPLNVAPGIIANIEFMRRFTAYCTKYKFIGKGNGFRPFYNQAVAWLAKQNDPSRNAVAYPGESWHGLGLAIDVARIGTNANGSGRYPGTIDSDYLVPPEKQKLFEFGLCIPMWINTAEKEPWHIIPVECRGIAGKDRQWFPDEDDLLNNAAGYRTLKRIVDIPGWGTRPEIQMAGADVKRLQRALGNVKNDGYFGPKTEASVKEYQMANNLDPDGAVGPLTWAQVKRDLLEPIPAPIDYKELYNLEKLKVIQMTAMQDDLIAENVDLKAANDKLYLGMSTILKEAKKYVTD